MVENGDPNLTVLGKLRTKKGEKELRREREDEGERIEESSEKMRRSARRNRGSGRDTVTERQQRSKRDRTLEERVADGDTQLDNWKSKPS